MALWKTSPRRLERWVARAAAGDRDAFRDVYQSLYADVARFVGRRVHNQADAEDVVALVFHKLLENLGRYEAGRASVRTWVLTIARNTIIDHFRTRRDHSPLAEDSLVVTMTPADQLSRQEDAQSVRRLLSRYSPQVQEMFALRYGDGLRHAEIAQLLGLSEAAVKQRFSRTLRELRQRSQTLEREVDYVT